MRLPITSAMLLIEIFTVAIDGKGLFAINVGLIEIREGIRLRRRVLARIIHDSRHKKAIEAPNFSMRRLNGEHCLTLHIS